jgi:hypothetical protein
MSTMFSFGGQLYDVGFEVIKWNDQGGYNGYKEPKRIFPRNTKGKKNIFDIITQLVVHHSGQDRKNPSIMFDVLWNQRSLSVHFAIEDNGMIYQFVDAIEKTSHASDVNNISIGCECCHFPQAWQDKNYYSELNNKKTGNLPHKIIKQSYFGVEREVYSFTDQTINSLASLYACCWNVIGKNRTEKYFGLFDQSPKFPRDLNKQIPRHKIENYVAHVGLIGHLHCNEEKVDPAGLDFDSFESIVEKYYLDYRSKSA